jgi:ABC-type transporter Mla subunit MlaD
MTMSNPETQIVLLVIAGLVALALLLQGFALLAIFFGMRKAASSIRVQLDELRTSVVPICKDAHQVFSRVAPRIEQATEDLAGVAHVLRTQSDDVKSVTAEIIKNTRRQAARIDATATTVMDAADRAVEFTNDTLVKPIRQLSGVLAAIRATVDALRSPNGAKARPGSKPGDPETFI